MELLKQQARDSQLTVEELLELLWLRYVEPRVTAMEGVQLDCVKEVLQALNRNGPKP